MREYFETHIAPRMCDIEALCEPLTSDEALLVSLLATIRMMDKLCAQHPELCLSLNALEAAARNISEIVYKTKDTTVLQSRIRRNVDPHSQKFMDVFVSHGTGHYEAAVVLLQVSATLCLQEKTRYEFLESLLSKDIIPVAAQLFTNTRNNSSR
jgi:hypothetical protein